MIFKIVFGLFCLVSVSLTADTCNEEYADVVGFTKLGSYKGTTNCGVSYGKTYYVPQYFKTFWIHARGLCQAYGMEILSLETLNEANSFLSMCDKNIGIMDDWSHIGAFTSVGKSLDKWYWVNSGKRVDYSLKFGPNQPDFSGGSEYCLSVGKRAAASGGFFFNDIYCTTYYENKFICQKTDF